MENAINTAETTKFDNLFNITFAYTEGGRWHTIEVNGRELALILNEGEIDGKQICAVEIWTVAVDGSDPVKVIYDFMRKATNQNPWVIV